MKRNNFVQRSLVLVLGAILIMGSLAWGAWDPDAITNSTKFKYWPGMLKDNFDAIETGTDAALQITNDKVSATAGIVDTKLATISSAGKVNATAITSLPSTPAGAGALPIANGGTAATSAAAARTSLGAAALGNNTDITRLNNLTTPLSVGQGGTGSATQNFVDLTTNQTVAGIKTLTSFAVTPSSAPTTDYQVANKKYVDDGDALIVSAPSMFAAGYGGDGSDGDVTISGATDISGTIKQYNTLTVSNGQTLTAKNCMIGVKGTLTITGTISAIGGGATGGSPGSATTGGVGNSIASAVTAIDYRLGGGGGGGSGVDAYAGGNGGSAGGSAGSGSVASPTAGGASAATYRLYTNLNDYSFLNYGRGAGGGGGGGRTGENAAYGGAGGGFIYIECNELVFTGTLTAAGSNGAAGNAFGSGGGGGGGLLVVKAKTVTTNSGTLTAAGGTGANANIKAGDGGAGYAVIIDMP